MYLRFPFVAFLLLLASYSFAQKIDSRAIIKKGIEYHDKGEFANAATEYLSVPMTDTNYLWAQYELALTYSLDSTKHDKGLLVIQNAKKVPFNTYHLDLQMLEASILDQSGETEKSLAAYDAILEKYPEYPQVYYEKAVVYYTNKEYEKAIELFEQSLVRNPFHFRSHFFMGKSFYMQGRIAESMIATHFALMTTNNAQQASQVISHLMVLSKGSDTLIKKSKSMAASYKDVLFDEMSEVLISRLVTNKKFVLKTDIDDIITRQLQVVYELAKYRASNNRFVNQYYIPYMEKIWKEELFNEHMLYLFSEYGFKSIDKKAKKNKKGIAELKEDVNKYFTKISSTREVNFTKRKTMPNKYLARGQKLVVGANRLKKNKKEEELVFEGPFKYYESGVLRSEGIYDKTNKKKGIWKYYDANGILIETEDYENGDLYGWENKYTYYGVPSSQQRYDKDERVVELKKYNAGLLSYVIKETKKGEPYDFTLYNTNGTLQGKYKMKDDEPVDGTVTYYHNNKKVAAVLTYKDKVLTGTGKRYFENGVLKSVEVYEKGKLNGLCKYYFKNGNIESEINYSAGEYEGPFKLYFLNGNVKKEGASKNGKFDGPMKNYLYDGTLLNTVEYSKGLVKNTDFSNPKIANNFKATGNEQFYYGNGQIVSDLQNNSNGEQEGISKYYYYSGVLREETIFKDGNKEGKSTLYYMNENKRGDYNYKKDEYDGLQVIYEINGDTSSVGYYVAGKKDGAWRSFDNGRLNAIETYKNGVLSGPSMFYQIESGKLHKVSWYSNGFFTGMVEYNDDGLATYSTEFIGGEGPYVSHHSNGNVKYQGKIKDGLFQGKGVDKYFDGKIKYTEQLDASKYQGDRKVYFYNGNISEEYTYTQDGSSISYNDYSVGGFLERKFIYTDTPGYYESDFYIANKLYCKSTYRDGDIDGAEYYYGANGKIVGVINYVKDKLVSYTYLDKSGTYVTPINLSNGSGKLIMFYQNGQKFLEQTYKNGYLDGQATYYYANGQIRKQRSYKNQIKIGKSEELAEDGTLVYSANYNSKGNLDGDYKQFDATGKLFYHVTMKDGIKVGTGKMFDPKTNKIMTITFANNRIIDAK